MGALGFRNLTDYIACCLLESGCFRPHYALDCEDPVLDDLLDDAESRRQYNIFQKSRPGRRIGT